jgi:FkbM family methyltransferase
MKTRASSPVRLLKILAEEFRDGLDKLPKYFLISGGYVDCEGVRLRFPKDVGISYTTNLFWHGQRGYEPTTTRVLIALVASAQHFIDIGSNIGFYSVLAQKLFPSLRVDAFEPIPTIYQKNVQFHRANGVSSENILQKACSNQDGTAVIYLPLFERAVEEDQTATLRTDSWQHHQEKRQEVTVETIKLDTFLKGCPELTPLLLKIDVEDHEAAVLQGASETLASRRPIILCEMLPRDHGNQETWKILEASKYFTLAITADGLFQFRANDSLLERSFKDFLCIPREVAEQFTNYVPLSALTEIQKK